MIASADSLLHLGREALLLAVLLSAPIVLVAFAVGALVSLFQAATQVQEETLPVAPKLAALFVLFTLLGAGMLTQLSSFAMQLFEAIGAVRR